MADWDEQLVDAAEEGDLRALQKCLAAGADPNAQLVGDWRGSSLHQAAYHGHADCVAALLAAGANPNIRDADGNAPLHEAARNGCAACVATLLAAAGAANAFNTVYYTPVHLAAYLNRVQALRLLLAAHPGAALLRDLLGSTPLQLALQTAALDAARCLLQHGPVQPLGELLDTIRWRAAQKPLCYALVATHQPLTAADLALVPRPCPGLGAALPTALHRSATEAALLVRHLPPVDQARLRTLALCLGRAQQRGGLPPLPTPLVWRLLALSLAD